MILIVLPDIPYETDLLAKAQFGDQAALRSLYDQYFPPVYQFIRLRIADREDARDLAADVFMDFFSALQRRKAPTISLRAWLFRVARNKLYDHYGKRRQFPTETLEEWVPADGESGPEAQFMVRARVTRVRHALRALPVDQQEVLLLRFGQGLNLEETADLMDKSVSAVKSLQFRAVSTLRERLDQESEV